MEEKKDEKPIDPDDIDAKRKRAKLAMSKLSPIDRLLVDRYTDPSAETFGNITQSGIAVLGKIPKGSKHKGTIQSKAFNRLVKPQSRDAIDAMLDLYGSGIQVRMQVISAIVRGEYAQKTRTKQSGWSAKGGDWETTTETEATPKAADIIRANAFIDKVTGASDVRRATASAYGKELSAIMKAQRERLAERIDSERKAVSRARAGAKGKHTKHTEPDAEAAE